MPSVVLSPSAAPEPLPIARKLLRRFYEPIILEAALIKTRTQGFAGPQRAPNTTSDSIDDAEQAFKCFVNRLAQVCDNQRGGTTVSAIAVLEEADCVHYIIGSNNRKSVELQRVREFARQLLELVGASQTQSNSQIPSVTRDLLWHILRFNKARVKAHLNNMTKYLDICIADYERKHPEDSAESAFKKQLLELKERAKFHENKDLAEDLFFTACEKLFVWVHRNAQRHTLAEAISQQAKDGQMDRSESWIELRHYVGRLHSYHLAVETIIRTSRRWSRLFHEVKVTTIPSASLAPNPLKKSKTNAHDIIGRMVSNKRDIEYYRAQVEELQQFRLDEAIQAECDKASHTHMVHCEVLVLEHVLAYTREKCVARFWNNWRFIGSSKPTCRLCSYYFSSHSSGVKVRESHGNLYPHWRAPDVFEASARHQRDQLLMAIGDRIRGDAMRSIQYQRPQGREHDSNSFSEMPPHLATGQTDKASISDIISGIGGLGIAPGRSTMRSTVTDDEDTQSVDGNVAGSDDEEEVIVFRGRRSL